MLIDDLVVYQGIENIERKDMGNEKNGIYNFKSTEGLITRLLRFSEGPFGRRKKWFK